MSIELSPSGHLSPGEHAATLTDVLAAFGAGSVVRNEAALVLPHLLLDAERIGAVDVYLGGSFVTNKSLPNDLDILIVHNSKATIPNTIDLPNTQHLDIDIQYASYDEPEILAAFIDFLSTRRNGDKVGLVRLRLASSEDRPELPIVDPTIVEALKFSYGLHYVSRKKRVLITVHGILTDAKWNADVSRLASEQEWVVAPYVYGFTTPLVLFSKKLRRKKVAAFTTWIDKIANEHPYPISVIAHSFGTYIIGRYLTGWGADAPPVKIKALVLTGAILDPHMTWNPRNNGFQRILNEVAPNDFWVGLMPLITWLRRGDPLGRAGTKGFAQQAGFLIQKKVQNYDHNNPLDAAVIRGRWLPFLNFNH